MLSALYLSRMRCWPHSNPDFAESFVTCVICCSRLLFGVI
jgi:hypothetical protein